MKKLVICSIIWVLLWPLALLVLYSRNRDIIICDIQKDISHRRFKLLGVSSVLYVFLLDKYYRSLIYNRLGGGVFFPFVVLARRFYVLPSMQ